VALRRRDGGVRAAAHAAAMRELGGVRVEQTVRLIDSARRADSSDTFTSHKLVV
jgi:hypothetical protein